ncbi:MAG: helix-turn-helix transcriptional regulator [Burkholderiaceae bacterium]
MGKALQLVDRELRDGRGSGPMDRLIRIEELMHITSLNRTSIYREIGRGAFPRPVKVTGRATAWLESEVNGWLAGLGRARAEK